MASFFRSKFLLISLLLVLVIEPLVISLLGFVETFLPFDITIRVDINQFWIPLQRTVPQLASGEVCTFELREMALGWPSKFFHYQSGCGGADTLLEFNPLGFLITFAVALIIVNLIAYLWRRISRAKA